MATSPCLQWSPLHRSSLNDAVSVPKTSFFGTMTANIARTRSFELKPHHRPAHHSTVRRTCSASFGGDEEFSRRIDELALRFLAESTRSESAELTRPETEWSPASIEMRAKRVDLPISLRMIKRKKNQLKESLIDASETARSSIRMAFSSMVFMIREVNNYSFQMREMLFYEDLQGVLARVQREMHASFVWLFQQVFSHTPTLMVSVMILLANFTVFSMSNTSSAAAFAAASPPSAAAEVEFSSTAATATAADNFDSIRSYFMSSPTSGEKTAAVGGGHGGGDSHKPVASGTDGGGGDGWTNNLSSIVSDGVSTFTRREEESVSGREDAEAWKSILDEASRMQGEVRDKSLADDVTRQFVSPVTTRIEADDVAEYAKTELVYQTELAQEPNNVLLLANYAQFLYLVVHDFDRAEEYFKRAIKVEPKDAEAHNKYANFLWQVRNDLWAAEETYLEAISADPSNSFYAANYAHFLWNTGGEDTCFPLDSPEDECFDS
ncbi:hypothetical protein vseg_013090 [Gypsophila vaccaria]